MTEHADGMTPLEAARVLAAARDYETDLRERTQGVTWMVWGIVTPAIFMTYAFAGLAAVPAPWEAFLWVPWVVAGYLATWALWRSAAIRVPALHASASLPMALRAVAVGAAFGLVFWLLPVHGPADALLAVGAAWTLMGAVNPWRSSRRNVVVTLVAGLLLAALGIGLLLARASVEAAGTASFVASGAVPLAAGLYLTLRG